MGKLKPIGSEKLGGMEKIQRILEISKYNLNTPQSINESESLEYSKTLADGNTYHITKEKNGYVIKKGLTESVSEYIEPMKNRKYYSSYSQALKRLNLIVKEVNVNEGYRGNLSLFNEQENIDDKKYFLVKGGETNEQEETQIPPAPAAPATPPAVPATPETEMPIEEPLPAEEPMTDEMPMDDEVPMDGEGETPQEEDVVTFKSIQKLTGKLAQKLRTFGTDEDNDMSSQDVKYVINSILSALDLSKLEPDDIEEITSKFEEGEEIEEPEMSDEELPEPEMGGEELPEPEMGGEELPEPEIPVAPEGEMAEMYPRHGRRESFEERQHKMRMKEMGYGVSESKVDRILQKYFNETPKNINESKLERLSENFKQESTSKRFLNKYPSAKLIGKNKKGTLVFEMEGEKFGVTTSGRLI
jgi:hypothetical protein